MISNTTVQAVYTANGVTRMWPIPFVYEDKASIHLRVSDGEIEREIAASNFTVDDENLVVIYPKASSAPAVTNGYKVAVYRETDVTQEVDFTNQGGVWPETVEAALDKLTEITQEHEEQIARCAKVSLTDEETPEDYSARLWAAADEAVAAAGEAAANAGTAQQYAQESGELYSQVLAAETAAVANIQTTKTTAISEIDAAADSIKDAAIADVQAEGARVTESISGMATTVAEQTSAAIASAAAASQSEQNARAYAEQAAPAATQAVASAAAAAASETAAAESEAAAKAAETATTQAAQTATTKAAEAAASATAAANSETAAAGSATSAANSADEVEDAKEEIIALAGGKFGFRQPNTTYAAEDMAFFGLHMSIWYLECITGGTTGSGDLVITNPQIDDIVIDGTVTWLVRKQSSTGTGTATTPGLTKLYTGTGNNADGTMTQAAISAALSDVGSDVSTLQTDVGTLQTDVTTAQGDIDTLEGNVGAAQSNISSLQGNMTTAQGHISTLQTSMTTVQTDITNLQNALSMTYKAKGSVAFANLPATLTSSMLGWVYNVYDDFTTDSRFVEGAGSEYFAGENVAVVETTAEYVLTEDTEAVDGKTYYSDAQGTEVSPQPTAGDDISSAGYYEYHPAEYKFDVLSGYINLSSYPRVVSFDATTATLTLTTL